MSHVSGSLSSGSSATSTGGLAVAVKRSSASVMAWPWERVQGIVTRKLTAPDSFLSELPSPVDHQAERIAKLRNHDRRCHFRAVRARRGGRSYGLRKDGE